MNMQMKQTVEQLEAQAYCLKQFARFIKGANASHMSDLARLLEGFNEWYLEEFPDNFEFAHFGLEVLTEIHTCSREDEGTDTARSIGESYGCLLNNDEGELFKDFIHRAHYATLSFVPQKTRQKTMLAVMREIVAEHPEPAASPSTLPKVPQATPVKKPKSSRRKAA